jgi:hypothetical protein
MRKFLISAALATAAIASAPAAAQYHPGQQGWNHRGPDQRAVNHLLRDLDELDRRVHRAAQRRTISPRDAFELRRQINRTRTQVHRSARNGLTGREFSQLRTSIKRLEQRVRQAERRRR